VLGTVTIASGVWLLYFSFWRPRPRVDRSS